ncbi:MAG: zinc ribbon domain-containing protein [Candidatus Hodarchaeota archaeon]
MESGERPVFYGKISVGDIVKRTFNIFKSNFSRFLLPFLILYSILGLILSSIYYGLFDLTYDELLELLEEALELQEEEIFLAFLVFSVAFLALIFFLFIGTGIVIQMAADAHEGKEIDLGKSFRVASSKIFSLIGAALLVGIITLIGSLLIIPGILFYVWFSLSAQAIILENKSAKASLSRSKELVKGNWWRTFGVIVVIMIIIYMINMIGSIIGYYLYDQVKEDYSDFTAMTIYFVFSFVFLAFLIPLYAIALTLLFIDLRIRQTLTPQVVKRPIISPRIADLCPQCSIRLPLEAQFCPNCGTKIIKEEEKRPKEKIKTCQFCGASVPIEAVFCIQCGRKLPKIEEGKGKICSNCGLTNPPDALFCSNCGSRLRT